MANKLVEMTFKDVNNLVVTSEFVCDENDITAVTDAIQAATNASTTDIDVTSPVNLALVTNNNPVAANIETCRTRLVVGMRGADLGNLVYPFAKSEFSVPAPDGSLYPYNPAVTLTQKLRDIVSRSKSASGVQMSEITKVRIARG